LLMKSLEKTRFLRRNRVFCLSASAEQNGMSLAWSCLWSGNLRRRGNAMKEGMTNMGKKEQRQFNQILDKDVKENPTRRKDVEARTVPKQHRMRGRKVK